MVLVVPESVVFVTSTRTPVIPSKLCAIYTVVEGFSEDGIEPTSKPLLVLGRAKPTFFRRFDSTINDGGIDQNRFSLQYST